MSFQNQTIRVVVRASFGGSRVRIRLSNLNGTQPLTLQDAHIGIAGPGASIQGPNVPLTFQGSSSVTIPVGKSVLSDGADLKVTALQNLAVSVYAPSSTGPGTGNTELSSYYIASGDTGSDTDGSSYAPAAVPGGYFVTGVDVYAPNDGLIVGFGDSITVGFNASSEGWPYWMANRLAQLAADGGPRLSIIDMGISGNRVTQDTPTAGVSAEHRLQPDVLDQTGLKAVLMMEGINDIGAGVDAPTTESGLAQIVNRVRGAGAAIVLSPLTPAGDVTGPTFYSPYYSSPTGVQERHDVNTWIRQASGDYASWFDFDPVVRDPSSPDHLAQAFNSGDNLHPNIAGQEALADSIDLPALEKLVGYTDPASPTEPTPQPSTGTTPQPPTGATPQPPAHPKPPAAHGPNRLLLHSHVLHMRKREVLVTFTCASVRRCAGLFSVDADLRTASGQRAPVVCLKRRDAFYSIPAHKTRTVRVPLQVACLTALRRRHGKLRVNVTSRPRTGQAGVFGSATLTRR